MSQPPGLYPNIPFDEYASWDAVNSHILNGFSRTPAHVYHQMTHGGPESTPAKDLGWFVHMAVLQPEQFATQVVIAPKAEKKTKVGKAIWAQFEAENAGKYVVTEETHAKATAMAKSLMTNETAREFFEANPGHNELSVLWVDKETGLLCKSRIDRVSLIGEWPIVGDLKSARNAGRRAIERAIYDYGYHIQGAHYLEGLEALYPVPAGNPFRRFLFFAIESEAPYLPAVYELDDAAIEEGKLLRRRYLQQWKECIESGNWPGYPQGVDYASLPSWAFKVFTE